MSMFSLPLSLSGMWLKTEFAVALFPFESVIINALRVRSGGDLLVEWRWGRGGGGVGPKEGAETDEVVGRFGLGGERRVWRTCCDWLWEVWRKSCGRLWRVWRVCSLPPTIFRSFLLAPFDIFSVLAIVVPRPSHGTSELLLSFVPVFLPLMILFIFRAVFMVVISTCVSSSRSSTILAGTKRDFAAWRCRIARWVVSSEAILM